MSEWKIFLFENKDKKTDRSPDYILNLEVDGENKQVLWGWKNVSKKGTEYLTFFFDDEMLERWKRTHKTNGQPRKKPVKKEIDVDELE